MLHVPDSQIKGRRPFFLSVDNEPVKGTGDLSLFDTLGVPAARSKCHFRGGGGKLICGPEGSIFDLLRTFSFPICQMASKYFANYSFDDIAVL